MSLYADILYSEAISDDDLRQDGNTWTITESYYLDEEIPGFADKELALAVVRALRCAYTKGAEVGGYS